jgi:tRNA A37 threonylcarbamoyladenosine dehydratase
MEAIDAMKTTNTTNTIEVFARSAMLLGEEAIVRLQQAHVAVFGVGGVGGAAAEALARGGVGKLTLVDHDVVSPSNLNRQVVALHSTLGRRKVEVMGERALDIQPGMQVRMLPIFYSQETKRSYISE